MLFGLGERDRFIAPEQRGGGLGCTRWRLADETFYDCIPLFKLLETLNKRPSLSAISALTARLRRMIF